MLASLKAIINNLWVYKNQKIKDEKLSENMINKYWYSSKIHLYLRLNEISSAWETKVTNL